MVLLTIRPHNPFPFFKITYFKGKEWQKPHKFDRLIDTDIQKTVFNTQY